MQDPPPPEEPPSLGQRMLAAIMFTDVVEFSRRVGADEERVLRLTSRDLRLIASLCEDFGGRVLKNTGDGCLALFTSGVQAVECAQAIQRQFAEHGQTMPAEDVLRHRIGIHLGDVYQSEDEVMGDGVNVAARLQAEAPAGGICISQALYEVVKIRLAFQTVHLGSKHLKNIKESVQVYQVLFGAEAGDSDSPATVPGQTRRPGGKVVWAGAGLLLISVVVIAWLVWGPRQAPPAPEDSVAALPGSPAESPGDTAPGGETPTLAAYDQIRTQHLPNRDYAALADWIKQSGLEPGDAALHADHVKYGKLADLFVWLEGELQRYTEVAPLVVMSPRVGQMRVWSQPDGELVMENDSTGRRPTSMRLGTAGFVANVMIGVARDKWQGPDEVKRETAGKLIEGMRLFVRESDIETPTVLAELRRLESQVAGRGTVRRPNGKDLLVRFDLNRDGRLVPDELPEELRGRLMRLDANGDGALTLEELGPMRRRLPGRDNRPSESLRKKKGDPDGQP